MTPLPITLDITPQAGAALVAVAALGSLVALAALAVVAFLSAPILHVPPAALTAELRGTTEYRVNSRTDIRLDGEPCKWGDVPDDAVVVKIDVAIDARTILRLWYKRAVRP